MSPNEPARNGITRRNFMKNTALTTGAVLVLSRGIGFATEEEGNKEPCLGSFTDTATGQKGRTLDSSVQGGVEYWEEYERTCSNGHTLGKFRKPVDTGNNNDYPLIVNPPTGYPSSLEGSGSNGLCYLPKQ